ncbi:MAG: acyl-CoA synthetase [Sulfobacillus acidophilus]|uniref:Acyl-CoA synthetase n=1 Tax=Sulfobacillus acidophilus TaxID=53633 RepID=A0A2T2WKW9_9FIRM|nr:MAG: acyl-CoA synthetase [Sulfobacillus acidophilus]
MSPIRTETLSQAIIQAWDEVPNAPAVYYFDTVWSFGDLMDRVMRVAGYFRSVGIGFGDRVGIMLQNMPATVVTYLASWAVGAAVVPLNVMFQPDELYHHLADSGAKALIVLASVYQRVGELRSLPQLAHIIVVDDRADFAGEAPPWLLPCFSQKEESSYAQALLAEPLFPNKWHPVQAKDMALLTYTSGTTGSPKGAINTHANILHNVSVYTSMAQLKANTVNIAFAPLFHITGAVAGLALSVRLAVPLVLLYRFDPRVAVQAIARRRATFTVGAITTFLGILELADLERYDLSSFCHAYSGGAPVPAATVDAFQAKTGIYIHNVYGLTESTNGLIMVPYGQRAPIDPQSGALSIGQVGSDIHVSIRDTDDPSKVLPCEALGELSLRGPSVVSGYWEKPEETAQSYYDGWFLTGDVARMDNAGWIYLVDRKKDVIISSGNKVWPRDVEDVLFQHPGVQEAVVVGLPDAYRGEAVSAFVVRRPEAASLTEAELLAFVRSRLAAYKVPRTIQWVESIPKTATGKFLRRAFRTGVAIPEIAPDRG